MGHLGGVQMVPFGSEAALRAVDGTVVRAHDQAMGAIDANGH